MTKNLTLSATIFLVAVMIVSGPGYAAAPTVDEKLPDIELLYKPVDPPSLDDWELDLDSFDLDDFIIDTDDAPGDITWGIALSTGHDFTEGSTDISSTAVGAFTLPTKDGGNLVDIFGLAYTGTVNVTYTADDLTDQAQAERSIHYASFRVKTPRVGKDNRIGTKVDLPFTWVIGGEVVTSPVSLLDIPNLDLITQAGAITGSPIVSAGVTPTYTTTAHDLDGNVVVVTSGLVVGIDANGQIYVQPAVDGDGMPTQANPLLVSFVASLPDGTSDWGGGAILLTPGLTPAISPKPTIEMFSSFEDGGTIGADRATMGTTGWQIHEAKTTGTYSIVDESTAPSTNRWPGAVSGSNVLKLVVGYDSSGARQSAVRLLSANITPVEDGATYGVSLNLATDAATVPFAPRVWIKARGAPIQDNLQQVKFGRTGTPLASDGWRQLFTTYTHSAISGMTPGAGGTGSYNLHYGGASLLLQFAGFNNASMPDTAVYVDNVHFYKLSDGGAGSLEDEGMSNADLSVGRAAMDVSIKTTAAASAEALSVDFEVADLAAGNWEGITQVDASWTLTEAKPKDTKLVATAALGDNGPILGETAISSAANHTAFTGSSKSLRIQLNGADGRTDSYGVRIQVRGLYDGVTGDILGPDVYNLSFYLQSDAAVMADGPLFQACMANGGPGAQFDAYVRQNVQGSSMPFGVNNISNSSTWRRISLTGTFPNFSEVLQPFIYFQTTAKMVVSGSVNVPQSAAAASYKNDAYVSTTAGYDQDSELAPYNGDANVYIDDVKIERVNLKGEYYDADLLQAP